MTTKLSRCTDIQFRPRSSRPASSTQVSSGPPCPDQSAISPQQSLRQLNSFNANKPSDLSISLRANATGSIKRAGVVVRDEEVVGSNPATPTRVIAGERL